MSRCLKIFPTIGKYENRIEIILFAEIWVDLTFATLPLEHLEVHI